MLTTIITKKFDWIGVILFFYLPINAQQDRFYTPYQGLSNTSFNSIAQDNEGSLWISTNGGLNKFDGYNFVVYQHNPLDTNSLNPDAVFSVFVDSKGKQWVGTERRLFFYNKKLDNFTPYPIRFQNREILPQINAILEDTSENLWLITSYGLIRINPRTNEQYFFNRKFADSVTLTRDMLNAAMFDNHGCLWIATDKNGLLCYNPSKNEFTSYRHDQTGNSVCDNSILSLGKDSKGNIIIGTVKGGISNFNPVTKIF